ncbi:NYN domain-containing protein [Thalassovita mangrovi]|uniref:NYN domain-containing protein n=1 Tax=Thalassovita mangrovi TaxID=2692236 RepID=A0A6L8LGW5_9RHOB|nr:NYN domain-containing protein [Thalassovita mangrovi]MYM55188.1 NYN domain-containing protein [Thalassovita mangrovi]
MSEDIILKLRTRIYIDGYNLYYGCLTKSPFKWLDVLTLFESKIIPSILYRPEKGAPPAEMDLVPDSAVKYFTAKIVESAAKGADSVSSQAQYHNALSKQWDGRVEFVLGGYALYKAKQALIPEDDPTRQPKDCEKVQVWKIEEKRSDVSIALHMFDDAMRGEIDQVILVTNDTDLVPAFEMLEQRCPQVVRGLVIPTRKSGNDQKVERQANASLSELAHWVRHYITEDELRQSQLPDVVRGGRRASVKPHSWYARPDHLQTMLDLARPVLCKDNATMKWAREPNKWLSDLRPIDLIETDEGAARVFAYIEEYVRSQS